MLTLLLAPPRPYPTGNTALFPHKDGSDLLGGGAAGGAGGDACALGEAPHLPGEGARLD